jgi:hypothetical protein
MALRSDATPVNELDATSCSVPSVSQSHSFEWSPKADYRYFQRRQSRDGRGAAGAPDDPSQKRHQGRDFAGRVGR